MTIFSNHTMEDWSKLLTAIASLVGALAWPAALAWIIYFFRSELRSILAKIPLLIDRVKKAKVPGLALELDQLADIEVEKESNKTGKITARQIETAARIEIETRDQDSRALRGELDRLCLEYDFVRRTLPSSDDRTIAMTRILVKMRSVAPSLIDFLEVYKGSGSPGSRLAAIAMMQMVPKDADINWLKERFLVEQPFLFYHAALALQNVANICETSESKKHLLQIAKEALLTVKNFKGIPDRETIRVLDMLVQSLS